MKHIKLYEQYTSSEWNKPIKNGLLIFDYLDFDNPEEPEYVLSKVDPKTGKLIFNSENDGPKKSERLIKKNIPGIYELGDAAGEAVIEIEVDSTGKIIAWRDAGGIENADGEYPFMEITGEAS